MKKLLAVLLFLPTLALGAANDLLINQRNGDDSGTLSRVTTVPPIGTDGLLGFNGTTVRPQFFTLGTGLAVSNGVLTVTTTAPAWASITGKPTFATVATSGAYSDLTGAPAVPAAQQQTDWNATSGVTAIANKPTTFPPAAHPQAWSTITATPTTLAGYGISDALAKPAGTTAQYLRGDGSPAAFPTAVSAFSNDAGYVGQSGARSAISLTTTGTSGAATYSSTTGVLNIPAYAASSGTVTSITAGTGLSGGTITASGTISLPNTGTAGSYNTVTTDAQGRVTAGTARAQSAATRALNTAFQVSASRDALVTYSVQVTVTASIAGGQNGDVVLEIASDSGFTANVQTLSIFGQGQTYTLAVALQGVQPQSGVVSGYVPAGYYARLRTVNNTGTPTFSYRAGQEVLQ